LFNTLIEYHEKVERVRKDSSIRKIQPSKMLIKLYRMFQYKIRKRDIEFKGNFNGTKTYSNMSDIYIAFFSLIENATKYALPKTTIDIDVSDINSKETMITIINECKPLSSYDLDHIIEFGYTGENSTGDTESTGYGL